MSSNSKGDAVRHGLSGSWAGSVLLRGAAPADRQLVPDLARLVVCGGAAVDEDVAVDEPGGDRRKGALRGLARGDPYLVVPDVHRRLGDLPGDFILPGGQRPDSQPIDCDQLEYPAVFSTACWACWSASP